MALDDRRPQTSRNPRMAWTPGEYIVGATIAALMATSTIVWAATQLAAVVAAGRPVGFAYGSAVETTVRLLANPGAPLAVLPPDVVGVGLTTALWWTSLIAVAVPIAAGARWVHRHTRARSAPSASWATSRQLADLRVASPGPGRLVIGVRDRRLIAAEPSQAVIVLGPARSGKTAGLAIPAILEWDGPVLATSVRTDLIDAVRCTRTTR